MSSYNTINDLASEVLEETKRNLREDDSKEYGIDPLTIIIIIGILVNVVRVIQECRKEDTSRLSLGDTAQLLTTDIRSKSNKLGFFQKRRLKNIIKQYLTQKEYNKYGDALFNALLVVGKKSKDEQVSALLEYKPNV